MVFKLLRKLFGTAQDRIVRRYSKIVREVNAHDKAFASLSDEEIRAKTEEFKQRFQKGESLDDLLPEAYGVVKNVCRRMIGTPIHVSGYDQEWDMVPYDVQIIGAITLHNGSIAEMQTGEGKTLTAVMPLYLNALSGKPVHLVTVNDYLAKRDCEWVGAVLRWLGLKTAALTNNTPIEERKEVYAADVVYGTASEFGFDYLRDNSMALSGEQQVQRGYFFTIIDEVDSILIDEARTPLIISGPSPVSRQMYNELKGGVAELVRQQRDLCHRLASEARKDLDLSDRDGEKEKSKEEREKEREALRKLWLVSKGTPRNKILKRVKENPDLRAIIDEWDLYFYSDNNKQEKIDTLAELFIVIDEKGQEYELSDKGIAAWGEFSKREASTEDFVMLDISHEYLKIDENPDLSEEEKVEKKLAVQEEDSKRKERAHNLRQMLRAHLLMEKDVDYIVNSDEVVIIDEYTGRPQPGRRFSDGLHQAIEAKEGVSIQRETQTYATVTLQNFFRMYEKRAGMTGTAITEAGEFKQIYSMDVLEIPTHKPCIRSDLNDEIYMTEREKYHAILQEVRDAHEKGRPILIGTETVEVSEKLARIFRQNKLPHTVLNAKHHGQEAEVVAHAGKRGAITIATNMAGRGTDIKLEKGVAELGGLYVIGTTRHQSRRIDRQLRGRCARQGDPGTSKFYLSFEDSLLRLFASPRMTAMIQKFRPPEGEPISAKILNKSIETAQKRVEQRNYVIRKHTLEYDDVMNKQRQEIYTFRNEILHSKSLLEIAEGIIEDVCYDKAHASIQSGSEQEIDAYSQSLVEQFPVSFDRDLFQGKGGNADNFARTAADWVLKHFKEHAEAETQKLKKHAPEGAILPENPIEDVLRQIMIRKVDLHWKEHLLTMDHLRADVSLRAIGQRDPLMEFKHEAFHLFDLFGERVREEIAQELFRFEFVSPEEPSLQQLLSGLQLETDRSFLSAFGDVVPQPDRGGPIPSMQQARTPLPIQQQAPEKLEPVTVLPKVKRNDPCPCGSEKKFKKCCGQGVED